MARVMEIQTPLGVDLLFTRMRASEELARLFEYRIELVSTKGDIDANKILGKNVTVKLELPEDKKRFFNGYVTRFAQVGMLGRYHQYEATVRPWLWFLTRTADCRIFQDKDVPQIVKEVLESHQDLHDFKLDLTGKYAKREYCVQYRETDFNFVSRLMEEEGIYYYFKHTDGHHKMVIADSLKAHSTVPDYEKLTYIPLGKGVRLEQESVSKWEKVQEIVPGHYTLTDHYFETPSANLTVNRQLQRNHDQSKFKMFDYPGGYTKIGEGEQLVRTRLEELQSRWERERGDTNARGVVVGSLLKLEKHPRADQNREYLLVSSEYEMSYTEYEAMDTPGATCQCSFTALNSKEPFRPQRLTPEPIVQGPQTAVVVGPKGDEIHTDKYGRVKVQFRWDRYGKSDENSSCWIRVSHPWAGKGWGSVSVPRIGQEVIVDFLEGDPDQPIITGRVYNAETMPPYSLPSDAVVSGIKSNTHKGKGYNEMSMNDTAGKEKITIHAQYDMNTTVEHDQTNTVNNKVTETIKSTADYNVVGAVTEKYDATQTTTVKDAITIVSTGGPIAISSDAQHVYINAGTNIQLHVGSSMIWMDSGGQINIQGVNVAINGSAAVTIKGGIVHSEAASEHQTKGAIVLSEGSATNTVKGGMVMLNP